MSEVITRDRIQFFHLVSKRFFEALRDWWWALPLQYWRMGFGAMWESVWRRRRRCVICGHWFWRQDAFNPLMGVNIFEEHCSADCAEEDNKMCERMFPHIVKEKGLVKLNEKLRIAHHDSTAGGVQDTDTASRCSSARPGA